MEQKTKTFFNNTIMLYILTFSKYLLGFITVPYETRVLGPQNYGLVGLATAIMVYFSLFIDFGFLLSATAEVSSNRENKKKLSLIFTSITINKIFLSFVGGVVLLILCFVVPSWKEHILFFSLFFLATAIGSFLPDYLYRGMEKMSSITVRTVMIQLFFTFMTFVFIRSSSDYMIIPIMKIIGNAVSLAITYIHLYIKHKIRFIKFSLYDILVRLKESSSFFFSRIASTVYTAANTIVLDLVSDGLFTGYYTSADRLITTAKGGLSPISDSLYPYMVKNKDFKLVKKILLLLEPIIILGSLILFIWAEPICIWFFGAEYAQTANAIRALLPIVVITLPNYIFGFPVLSAVGLTRHANYSVIIASVVHVINVTILILLNKLSIVTLGIATSITEFIILVYRILVVVKYKKSNLKG